MNIGRTLLKLTAITALTITAATHYEPPTRTKGCALRDIQSIITGTSALIKSVYEEEPSTQPHDYSFNNPPTMERPQ
jgi:hypothetical protein